MPDKLVWFALDPERTDKVKQKKIKFLIHYSDYLTVITLF